MNVYTETHQYKMFDDNDLVDVYSCIYYFTSCEAEWNAFVKAPEHIIYEINNRYHSERDINSSQNWLQNNVLFENNDKDWELRYIQNFCKWFDII